MPLVEATVFVELWQDLRHGSRGFLSSPGVAAVTIVSLGIGIGVATTVASVANGLLYRTSTGLSRPDRLVRIYTSTNDGTLYGRSSPADFADLADGLRSVNGIAASRWEPLTLGRGGPQRILLAERVSPDYFSVLGVEPRMGRAFSSADVPEDVNRVAVVSHRFWTTELRSAPNAIGAPIDLGGRSTVVIGVMPPDLDTGHPLRKIDVWLPFPPRELDASKRDARRLDIVARLATGANIDGLNAELDVTANRLHFQHPRELSDARGEPLSFHALPEQESRLTPDRHAILSILALFPMALALLVLLIACLNVATLFLAIANQRAKETALRLALGASRGRLAVMFFLESLPPAIAASALGLLFAWATTRALAALPVSASLPMHVDFGLDPIVAAFAAAVGVTTALVFGVGPHLLMVGPETRASAPGATTRGSRPPGGARLRRALVIAQVACSLTLMTGSGLFYRSVKGAASRDLGLDPSGIALTTKAFDRTPTDTTDAAFLAVAGTLDRLRAHPEVTEAHASTAVELTIAAAEEVRVTASLLEAADAKDPAAFRNQVTPGYLRMLDIDLTRGRALSPADRSGTERVAVVNDVLARRLWPDEDPIGRRFRTGDEDGYTVVGVARDGKFRDIDDPPAPYFWTSLLQGHPSQVAFVVEGRSSAAAMVAVLGSEVERSEAEVPRIPPGTLDSMVDLQLGFGRLAARVLGWGGVFGLVLAAVGIYGIVSFSVESRKRELAIRLAVGARRGQILRLVLGEGIGLTLIGISVGCAVSSLIAHGIRAQLLGTSPTDPVTLAAAAAVMLAVAVAASYRPAKRAAAVDPVTAIRQE